MTDTAKTMASNSITRADMLHRRWTARACDALLAALQREHPHIIARLQHKQGKPNQ